MANCFLGSMTQAQKSNNQPGSIIALPQSMQHPVQAFKNNNNKSWWCCIVTLTWKK